MLYVLLRLKACLSEGIVFFCVIIFYLGKAVYFCFYQQQYTH